MTMRAMLLAAGRGERMRPLTDGCPKPLLPVGGKPLIEWQIERMVKAGYCDVVINVSYLAQQIVGLLGDGSRLGARITYSHEVSPLESAGGLAEALGLLGSGPVLVGAADVYTDFDYSRLADARARIDANSARTLAHLVLVPNPPFRPHGDYSLNDAVQPAQVGSAGNPRWTWAGIGIFHTNLLREIPNGKKIPLLPFFTDWIERGLVSGELHHGVWDNLGTPEQLQQLDVKLGGASSL
ncbi:MAG: N-acetylmuramate alpha-1-phosphate uridylyltransferase MurU [Betaproteobacteria bacterium]